MNAIISPTWQSALYDPLVEGLQTVVSSYSDRTHLIFEAHTNMPLYSPSHLLRSTPRNTTPNPASQCSQSPSLKQKAHEEADPLSSSDGEHMETRS
ncbi:hypothetical protein SCP_0606500 [Sparassis crispa]|uniref:Uncharacterized protein n=1 Tax=Sparassis crispa TaxID=139825 RepID=A0A401GQZ4_9APHY|nr:hypothetical protein SCP_0606500 [Sparassis crispa]GBE84671.1 hypothetical protein SCP_0606500 [Sparassis crispa]